MEEEKQQTIESKNPELEEKKQQTMESNNPKLLVVSPEKMIRVSSPSRDEDCSKSSSSSIPLVPLQLPKAFNYPERYKSPTDTMVSPITKGILARKTRPPSATAPSTLFQGVDSAPSINLHHNPGKV
ncbi:hypothetical protein LINGRAHAP2_LOCUS6931 [Linum grandiflorum]